MTTRTRILLLVLVAVLASLGVLMAQAEKKTATASPAPKKPGIAYPAYPNDPRHWRHVRSMVIYSSDNPLYKTFPGLHNVYVNDIGWPSLQHGRLFPDGSVLALELFDISSSMGAIEPRGRTALFLMKKNAKLYSSTGGWGFEVFKGPDNTPTLKDMKECFECHKVAKPRGYIRSEYMQ
jgi:hypothetical protein